MKGLYIFYSKHGEFHSKELWGQTFKIEIWGEKSMS